MLKTRWRHIPIQWGFPPSWVAAVWSSKQCNFFIFISLLELTFMSTTSTWRSRTTSPSFPGTRSGTTPVFPRSGTSPAVSFPAAFTFLLHYTFRFFIIMYISAIKFPFLPLSSFMFTIEDHPFLCQWIEPETKNLL